MHFELSQTCFFFEFVFEPDFNYFNLEDYQVYSTEEHQVLINSNTYEKNTFLPIPQIDRNEIVVKYLTEKNNLNLLRKKIEKDFYHKFHRYIEDNHFVEEWNNFEKAELISFAAVWCKQNQIEFMVSSY